MIATERTLSDLILQGKLDGYERVLVLPECTCGGSMRRDIYVRPATVLRRGAVKVIYQCRRCGHTEVIG